uniref:Uncharacterized protein n=1 Tax=Setaria italica TaxID=4555 RepID=K3XT35_SETIT
MVFSFQLNPCCDALLMLKPLVRKGPFVGCTFQSTMLYSEQALRIVELVKKLRIMVPVRL